MVLLRLMTEHVTYTLHRLRQAVATAVSQKSGQTMIEYIVVTCLFLGLMVVMGVFVYALRQHSDRVLDLVASDYP